MSDKRDSKRKPEKDEQPKLDKETLKDLDVQPDDEDVKGGAIPKTNEGCPSGTYSCRL